MNTEKNQESVIYKDNEKQESSIYPKKTGNTELDKGLKELRLNSMPTWAKIGGSLE